MIEALLANPVAATLAALALGLLVGSFLNVVILRLPRRLEWQWKQDARELLELPESYEPAPAGIVVESSHCPHCGHKLAAWENVPLLSYVALRGKCRACHAPISLQYPAVELLTGLLFAACIWRFGAGVEGGLALVFTSFLIALSGIDLRTTWLPDALTQPLLWIGLLASLVTVFVDPVQALLGATAGYLSLWSVYWLFKLVTGKEGMGEGDFKLLAALGAWCGASAIIGILMVSSLVGAVVGGSWLLLKGKDRSTQIPFGPYLAIAGWMQFYFQFDLLAQVMRWTAPGWMATFVVAVTGGIASGKSAVCALFARIGVAVADADAIAHAIVEPGEPALAEIVARFGAGVLRADGALDRAHLREQVFADAGARAELEAITHPRIRAELQRRCLEAAGDYAIADIPLLAESAAQAGADYSWLQRVLVVDAPTALQRARLLARDGIEPVLAERMIAAQATRGQRLALASDVIVNDGPLAALAPAVRKLDERFRRLAAGG